MSVKTAPTPIPSPASQERGESSGLRVARTIGSWLFGIGYALWLGGLVALGALMVPNVAATLHTPTVVAGGEPLRRAILNGIVGNSFHLFNDVCYGCYGAMLLGTFLEMRGAAVPYRKWTMARFCVAAFAAVTLAWLGFLFANMDIAQASGNMRAFDAFHHQYEAVSMLQLPLLLVTGALTACRDWFARNDRN